MIYLVFLGISMMPRINWILNNIFISNTGHFIKIKFSMVSETTHFNLSYWRREFSSRTLKLCPHKMHGRVLNPWLHDLPLIHPETQGGLITLGLTNQS